MNFCITLTTIPSRIKTIYKTIDSINNQIIKPDIIYLNIPYEYKRFNTQISEKDIIDLNLENVKVIRCEDFGPATSFLGPIKEVQKKYDFMIILNNDHIYDKNMTEIFVKNFRKEQINYSFYIQKIFSLNMAQCADGFLIKTDLLNNAESFYRKYVEKNKNLRVDDDLWISIYLQKIMKSKIKNLINEFREKTKKEVVYEVHTTMDSLVNNVHKRKVFWNRKKIAKIEIIKFNIKNYFNNFNQS